jgi:hypothetical protein
LGSRAWRAEWPWEGAAPESRRHELDPDVPITSGTREATQASNAIAGEAKAIQDGANRLLDSIPEQHTQIILPLKAAAQELRTFDARLSNQLLDRQGT